MIRLACQAGLAYISRMGVLCPRHIPDNSLITEVPEQPARPKVVLVDPRDVSVLPDHAQRVLARSRQGLRDREISNQK